jgi:hypothetical protein
MRKFNWFTVGVVLLMVLSLALSFPAVAEPVGKVVNILPTKIVSVAKFAFMMSLGVFLVVSGIAALSVPVVGISLILIGVALMAIYAVPFFKGSNSPG